MASKTQLTDVFLRKAKGPERGQRDVWDAKIPGFGIRLSATGVKTFVMVYRYRGKWRRDTLGRYPETGLQQARAKAERARAELSSGSDPRSLRQTSRPAPAADSFEDAADAFIKGHVQRHNRASTAYESERLLRTVFVAAWSRHRLAAIQRADVLEILDGIAANGTPSAARHAFALIRKFFNWCVERQRIAASPCAGLKAPGKPSRRERTLDAAELAAIWQATAEQADTFGHIVQILALTAQRRCEVSAMQWAELDEAAAVWTIPAQRTKNGRSHAVPLSAAVLAILAQIPKTKSPYVFPARGTPKPGKPPQSFSGWSKAKRALDAAAMLHDWTLHDLRRTAATMMAKQGTPPHVVERVLNHVSGTFAGVAGIYNRHQYADEMRAALDAWARQLVVMVAPPQPETCP